MVANVPKLFFAVYRHYKCMCVCFRNNPSLTLDLIYLSSDVVSRWVFCSDCVLFLGCWPLHIVRCCPVCVCDAILWDFSFLGLMCSYICVCVHRLDAV